MDLQGYYGDVGDGFTAAGPVRVLDTRHAIGTSTTTPLAAGSTITLSLAGKVPAGTTAVAMNLTETGATGNGVSGLAARQRRWWRRWVGSSRRSRMSSGTSSVAAGVTL
jgi:hypothetical protein